MLSLRLKTLTIPFLKNINGRSCISKGITSPITIEIMVPFETIELWGLLKHSRMSYGLLAFHNINNPNCFADMAKSIVNLIKQNEKGVR